MKQAVDLTFENAGEGKIPIICLHGIGGNTDSFRPQLRGLSDRYQVIAWNMPGYGGSRKLDDMTFATLAERLVDLLESLGFEQAHLVGQSIGGMIALETAVRFPEKVRTLTLIGATSAFGGRDDSFKESFIAARLKPLDAGKTMGDLAKQFVPEIVGPIADTSAINSAIASMAAVPEETYRQVIACLVTFNRRADIENLKLPVCVIAGEFDQNAPARTLARMADKIDGAEFHEVEGAGHLINLEDGKTTNTILDKFLQRNGGEHVNE